MGVEAVETGQCAAVCPGPFLSISNVRRQPPEPNFHSNTIRYESPAYFLDHVPPHLNGLQDYIVKFMKMPLFKIQLKSEVYIHLSQIDLTSVFYNS